MFLDPIILFLKNNLLIVILVVIMIFVFLFFLRRGKEGIKHIKRSEVERKRFIERNKLNISPIKWLYRGEDNLIGKIKYWRTTIIPDSEDANKGNKYFELVVKPVISFLKIDNPLAKEMCILINKENTIHNFYRKVLYLDPRTTFDCHLGIYYDRVDEKKVFEWIKGNNFLRTDLDSTADIYYNKSQEQATYDPMRAHDIQKEILKLEQEKEKRARVVS